MILIISDNNDVSTNDVIDWLYFHKLSFFRINDTDKIQLKFLSISNDNLNIALQVNDNVIIKIDEIKSFWYRRGYLNYDLKLDNFPDFQNKSFGENVKQFHINESISLIQFINLYLKNIKNINGFFDNRINKLYSLFVAKQIGITIPITKILTRLDELNDSKEYINKAIKQGFYFKAKGESFSGFTARVDSKFKDLEMNDFFPTLFQEEIKKQFEIRSFYLHGTFYSMAIFSQNNKNTEVDFRKYDNKTPNRTIPFNLPKNIEVQLTELMGNLNLNSGSIDLIVDDNDNYVFLEVNPIGQFRQVSKPCNYYIEKRIAEYLKNE